VSNESSVQNRSALNRREQTWAWLRANPAALPIGLLAFAVRLVASGGPNGLKNALGYDPAVYFQAGQALAVGELPYRDFTLVHPPGIAVLLAPFSLLANATNDVVAFASARLVFITLGAIGAILIYVVARRLGTVTAIVAGLTYCIAPGLVYTERTTYLEVFMVLATLVGLLLFNRAHPSKIHLVLGGALFGLAVSTKLWALVPLLVITIGLVALKSWRQAALYLGSAAAFGVLLMGPFFLAAPQQMYQMIVVDQLGRPPLPGHGLPRLGMVFGIDEKLEPTVPLSVAVTLLILLLAASLFLWIREPVTRIWVALFASQVAVVLLVPTFFFAYKAYYAVGIALVLGAIVQSVWDYAAGLRERFRALGAAITTLLLLGLGVSWLFVATERLPDSGTALPVSAMTAAVENGRCVTSDSPALQITSNSLTRSLSNDCPIIVDIRGATFSSSLTEYEELVVEYLNSGDYVILTQRKPIVSAPALAQVTKDRPVVQKRGKNYVIYGPRTTNPQP
jgi:alpha-1,2-mannosyltransferase